MDKRVTQVENAELLFESYGLYLIDEYKGFSKYHKCTDKDGYIMDIRPNDLNRVSNRNKFGKSNKYSIYNVGIWLKINDKTFTFKEDQKWNGVEQKYIWVCKIHGEFQATWDSIYHNNTGCPSCGNIMIGKKLSLPKLEKSIFYLRPDLVKYFKNPDDSKLCYVKSNIKVELTCPNCGTSKFIAPSTLSTNGFGCNSCSDGVSIPEKFISNLLMQLDIKFETQYSPAWSNKKRYDFYIPSIDMIIETHGQQHYVDCGIGLSYKEVAENDLIKLNLAHSNKVSNYVVINCRYSTLEWLKKNCISGLSTKICLNNVDWELIFKQSQTSMVIHCCELWNSGIYKNASHLLKHTTIKSSTTVVKYLKIGTGLGICNYNTKEITKDTSDALKKKVRCITTGKIYDSLTEASVENNISIPCISCCCNGKQKSAGKHPETNVKLKWEYV